MLAIDPSEVHGVALGALLVVGGLVGAILRRLGASAVLGWVAAGVVLGALIGPGLAADDGIAGLALAAATYAAFVVGVGLRSWRGPRARLVVLGILALVPLASGASSPEIMPQPGDLLAAAAVGLVVALAFATRSGIGDGKAVAAAAVLAVSVVLARVCPASVALLAGALLVGIGTAIAAPELAARAQERRDAFELALALAVGFAATRVELDDVLAWGPPAALLLVGARALGVGLPRRATVRPPSSFASSSLVLDAALAIVLLDALVGLVPPVEPYRGLVVALVLLDALAGIVMSSRLARRRRSHRALELPGLDRDVGSRVTHAAQEPCRDIAAIQRLVLAVEHEAAQPHLEVPTGPVAHEKRPGRTARRRVGAEGCRAACQSHGVLGVETRRRREHDLAGGIADGEVEPHHVGARDGRVGDRDLGAVDGTHHDRPRADGDEAALHVAHPQVVADPVAVLDPEHDRMKDVAKPW
jgi:hypothetical protein